MQQLSKKEMKILVMFEHGFTKEQGYKLLLEEGFTKKELDTLIEKLKKESYLDDFDTPVGRMLCTLYIKISMQQLDKFRKKEYSE